jgi:predicted RNA-binding protein with PUA-like domain
MPRPRTCWLVKSEADCFSIDDLAAAPGGVTCWSGVRNYQARNFMRDSMKLGDEVLYYHSNAEPTAVVGRAVVAREGYPDSTAWDSKDDHFDPKASPDNPIWQMVDIRFVERFPRALSLDVLKREAALGQMELLRRGSRLSVQPVRPHEYDLIVRLAHEGEPSGAQPTGSKKQVAGARAKKVPVAAAANRVRVRKTKAKPAAGGKASSKSAKGGRARTAKR